MYSHEPADYACPFCALLRSEDTLKSEDDIVYQDDAVTAFVSPKWWVNNPGNVIIIPNNHTENIYSISDDELANTYIAAKKIATAMRKSYQNCSGISMRQHNEPNGNQDVWHFHVHVFPRFADDELYVNHGENRFVNPEERLPYVKLLRDMLSRS